MKTLFFLGILLFSAVMKNQAPQKGHANVNGTRLYYEMTGEGPPIVLIHGFSLDNRMWNGQLNELTRTHQVIRYDLRGFGNSELPKEGEHYTHEEDLHALLAHLHIKAPIVVGLSLGGRIAINYALLYPKNVKALILADAVLDGYKWQDYSMTAVYDAAKNEGIQAGIQKWLEHPTFAQTKKNLTAFEQVSAIVSAYSGWHFLHKNPLKPTTSPAIAHLSEINLPTLVIVGEKEIIDFWNISEILAQQIPNATKVVIKGAGHMSNMEDPAAFNLAMHFFLEKL